MLYCRTKSEGGSHETRLRLVFKRHRSRKRKHPPRPRDLPWICSSCRDNIIFQDGVQLQRYIESFAIPILVVDSNVKVTAVNSRACEILGKEPKTIVQHLGGNVFECEYARLPEGCGRTIHCSGCTIRKAVTKCFATGKPQSMVPAYINPDSPSSRTLSITTVKVDNLVMLRIDHLQ